MVGSLLVGLRRAGRWLDFREKTVSFAKVGHQGMAHDERRDKNQGHVETVTGFDGRGERFGSAKHDEWRMHYRQAAGGAPGLRLCYVEEGWRLAQ